MLLSGVNANVELQLVIVGVFQGEVFDSYSSHILLAFVSLIQLPLQS